MFAAMMKDLNEVTLQVNHTEATNTRSAGMDRKCREFFVDHGQRIVGLMAVIAATPVMQENAEALVQIAEIDKAFEDATGYGSWMIERANTREALVNMLRGRGIMIDHKHQARLAGTDVRVD